MPLYFGDLCAVLVLRLLAWQKTEKTFEPQYDSTGIEMKRFSVCIFFFFFLPFP